MKVIEREFLSEVSGAGGRNDPSFNSGRNNNSNKGGSGSQYTGNPRYNDPGVANCNNSIIGGALGGAVTGAFTGGPAGALAGAAGGAITGGITGCFNSGSQGSGAGKGTGTNSGGGLGGSCTW